MLLILFNMSFFNDFLNYFKIDNSSENTIISAVVGVGIMIVGKVKIISLGDSQIQIKSNKDVVSIDGDNLKIKSLAKGEIVISGKINKIDLGKWLWKMKCVLKLVV